MKKLLFLLLLTPGLVHATGFIVSLDGANEVPPNRSPYTGVGSFSLVGTNLDGAVDVNYGVAPTSGGIFGPALPGQDAPLIFSFSHLVIFDPGGNFPGGVGYLGDFTLTPQQITDLDNGFWYINITSAAFPGGEVRGQILPVPEPSALSLVGVGLAVLGSWTGANACFNRTHQSTPPPKIDRSSGQRGKPALKYGSQNMD